MFIIALVIDQILELLKQSVADHFHPLWSHDLHVLVVV